MKKHLILPILLFAAGLSAQPLDMKLLHGLHPRSIGPAGMSGRVTAFDVVHSNPDIIYAGTASGGLWKSTGGGVSWTPVFDSVDVASIGAIAIDQGSPDVVWVGTGEGNPRNSQTMGGGVYRTFDGGRSWQYMGLRETRTIHRLILHRDNPNVVFAGAQGNAWADSEQRGVYRTTDGGRSWARILYVNPRAGVGDMVADPGNPNKLFVSMWEYRRWPWLFQSGGPGSGLYLTLDGGDTWKRLGAENGLPEGELGKIGLAIAPGKPEVVYAFVESSKNALYRSDDGGYHWKKINETAVGDRPFYYGDIAVDPVNENRLYSVHSSVTVSIDGGKTFEPLLTWGDARNIHGDHHAWYVHPRNPNFILDGNDGGMAISRDRGLTWRFVENLPVGQFYHVRVDDEYPYNLYGGMQDNGTWRGPNTAWRAGGVRNAYFDEIGFGDGFDAVPERDNSRYGYVMWQGGNLLRVDFQTGAQQGVKPRHPDGVPLRFNWNAGMADDPFAPATIYYGSQFLHRSTDRGKSWQVISPDLTTNDPQKLQQKKSGGLTYDVTGAENHCTILAISPSPLRPGVIWVGTDDGNVQLTQDGGVSWTNMSDKLKGLPLGSWIPQVHASAFDPAEAYVVANNYRRGDWTPYLYRTRDYGKTWEPLAGLDQVASYCLSWTQDPVERRLQFLGTESGLYVSIDEGKTWTKWTNGYPASVSTYDMTIHPREHDLVIGTFGRAFYLLDDIRPLRALARQGVALLDSALYAFPAPDAYLAAYQQGSGTRFTGQALFQGENRPYGALITFSVKEVLKKDDKGQPAKTDSLKVEVLNKAGRVLRRLRAPVRPGLNRFSWDLSTGGVRLPMVPKPKADDALPPAGHPVLPGVYAVRLSYGGHVAQTLVTVRPDPRLEVRLPDVAAFYAAWEAFDQSVAAATAAMDKLRDAKRRLDLWTNLVKEQVKEDTAQRQFQSQVVTLKKAIDSLSFLVMPGEDIQGIFDDPDQLSSKISAALFYFNPSFDAPNPAFHAPTAVHQQAVAEVKNDIIAFVGKVNRFFETDWRAMERQVDALRLDVTQPVEE